MTFDPHTQTAAELFRVKEEEVTAKQRRFGKQANFIFYSTPRAVDEFATIDRAAWDRLQPGRVVCNENFRAQSTIAALSMDALEARMLADPNLMRLTMDQWLYNPRSPVASTSKENAMSENTKLTALKDFVAEELRKLANKLDPSGSSANVSGVDVHGLVNDVRGAVAAKHDELVSGAPAGASESATTEAPDVDVTVVEAGGNQLAPDVDEPDEEDATHGR